jgi:hypothetical protein
MNSAIPSSTESNDAALAARYPTEGERITRVLRRHGEEGAREWARRTAGIYRTSVLNRQHFAHAGEHRRQFIRAYLELKDFARAPHDPRSRTLSG